MTLSPRLRNWLPTAILLLALILFVATFVRYVPAQAAPPADPEVVPCQAINTAAINDTMTIMVFRCQPENGAPYLLNSAGFMVVEEW